MICCLILRFVRQGFVSPYALLPLALENNPLGRALPREGLPFLGAQEFLTDEVWVYVPAGYAFALLGLQPSPATRNLTVSFSLPNADPALLELFDVSGRRLLAHAIHSPGAGNQVVNLGDINVYSWGCHFLRLTQGPSSLVARAVILR